MRRKSILGYHHDVIASPISLKDAEGRKSQAVRPWAIPFIVILTGFPSVQVAVDMREFGGYHCCSNNSVSLFAVVPTRVVFPQKF
jgi:hypothetical protein